MAANTFLEPMEVRRRILAEHAELRLLDSFVAPAVREVVGWGPILQERLAEDHEHQREHLRNAIAVAENPRTLIAEFAASVRSFVHDALRDCGPLTAG